MNGKFPTGPPCLIYGFQATCHNLLKITSDYSKKRHARCIKIYKDTELGMKFCWNTLAENRLQYTDVIYMLFQLKREDAGYACSFAFWDM